MQPVKRTVKRRDRRATAEVVGIVFIILFLAFGVVISLIVLGAVGSQQAAGQQKLREAAAAATELIRIYVYGANPPTVNATYVTTVEGSATTATTTTLDTRSASTLITLVNKWGGKSLIDYALVVGWSDEIVARKEFSPAFDIGVGQSVTIPPSFFGLDESYSRFGAFKDRVSTIKVHTVLGGVFGSGYGIAPEAGVVQTVATTIHEGGAVTETTTIAGGTPTTVTVTTTMTTTVGTQTTTSSTTQTRTTTQPPPTTTPALSLFLHTDPGDAESYVKVTGTFNAWGTHGLGQGQAISETTDGVVEYEKFKRFTFESWDVTWQHDSQSPKEQVTSTTSLTVSFTATNSIGTYNAIAHFKREYYLSIGADPANGAGEPTSSRWVEAYTDFTVDAGPYTKFGWEVDTWFVDGVPKQTGGNSCEIYMDDPHSIVIKYKQTTTTGTTTSTTSGATTSTTTTTQQTTISTTTTTSTSRTSTYCLLKGTLVNLSDGSQIPVEELRVGDQVLSYDLEHKVLAYGTVKAIENIASTQVYELNDGLLFATKMHRVYTKEGWKPLVDLSLEDEVYTLNGWVGVRSVGPLNGSFIVYKLTVPPMMNLFTNGVLSHNYKPIPSNSNSMQSTFPLIPLMLFAVATEAYKLIITWRTSTERRVKTCQSG